MLGTRTPRTRQIEFDVAAAHESFRTHLARFAGSVARMLTRVVGGPRACLFFGDLFRSTSLTETVQSLQSAGSAVVASAPARWLEWMAAVERPLSRR